MAFDAAHEATKTWWVENNILGKDWHNEEMWEGENFGFTSAYSNDLEGLKLSYLKGHLFQFLL